ncbi:MAG TPA: hypothetical protein DEV93_12995 [Chloroflexi bacterium]|nr:hypothetical protein [Chloroflexota bacterium]
MGNATADVVIVGGGFTGLWTAYFLKELRPELGVVVLEQDICGGGPLGGPELVRSELISPGPDRAPRPQASLGGHALGSASALPDPACSDRLSRQEGQMSGQAVPLGACPPSLHAAGSQQWP